MYVQNGQERLSEVFSEEIVSREIDYLDREGRITEVRLLWGVDSWNAPNWTQATLEGLNLQTLPNRAGHDREGEGLADDAIYELIQTVPLPRRYVGKVWGPRGAQVEYRYQLLRTNSPLPEDDFAMWITDNGSQLPGEPRLSAYGCGRQRAGVAPPASLTDVSSPAPGVAGCTTP